MTETSDSLACCMMLAMLACEWIQTSRFQPKFFDKLLFLPLKERTAAFLETMAVDASGSRKETGCHTFDLLKDDSDPQKFYFYEGYIFACSVSKLPLKLKLS